MTSPVCFEPVRKYIDASDIAVCEFETPIARASRWPRQVSVFSIPSEVARRGPPR